MDNEYEIDPERLEILGEDVTGIYVRAKDSDGKWTTADIAVLKYVSLRSWLRSRGGANDWAESVVFTLLGYKAPGPEDDNG
jgi:hypothetical protein